jgi:hypothetical protein
VRAFILDEAFTTWTPTEIPPADPTPIDELVVDECGPLGAMLRDWKRQSERARKERAS